YRARTITKDSFRSYFVGQIFRASHGFAYSCLAQRRRLEHEVQREGVEGFNETINRTVLLMSLKAGVELNLTASSHVFLTMGTIPQINKENRGHLTPHELKE
ncbi:hypothetical protein HID58_022442, partial [Brassica napus]